MALRHNQRVTADIVPMEETDEDEPDSTIQPLMMLKRNLICMNVIFGHFVIQMPMSSYRIANSYLHVF
ncbi:hypothetical protein DPMN_129203 [Dreissena polymorpha]|uniref:Uncharacterized protein n=1 Tax=Dreissena polymorpha TaxID=45954 RepID=A0A9D4K0B4_DREPO|nr:hypothetical protein DPMN_129203 [Dreissena polymorpha]